MNYLKSTAAFLAIVVFANVCSGADSLAEQFRNPPDSARPHTWWHWMNGNVSREGISKDLEAMKRVGLGGFQAFHVTDGIPAPSPAHAVGYMSKEWLDLMGHTIREADRLGLEVCMHNCAGWSSSGGPWISPEMSMQEIVWSETTVRGGSKVEVELKQPETRKDFYRDVIVIAFPSVGKFRIENWEWKIDRAKAGRKPDSQIVRDTREAPAGDVIKLADIVALSDKMDASGKLSWDAPAGEWTILRFGHTTTGRVNKPAPKEGEGLECNKLDRTAVKLHWDNSVARVLETAGPLAGKAFNNVLIDSYEVGFQNWTSGFEKIFQQRSGYELTKYMPCLTGRVVESVDTSERFLWDFRRVIADAMAENYFGYFKVLAHERGLKLSIEPYGPGGFDDFQVAAIADIPMGEFWIDRADAWHLWSVKLASSAAHANGLKFVGAESFTANPPASRWNDYPSRLKTLGDSFFAQGLNRIIFHTNVHQPWGDDVLPGMTMGPHGMQMNRNNTWHAVARPWVDHLARTQFMLQSGEPVVDLCYVASEDAPQTPVRREDLKPAPPAGYDYDMIHSSFVMQMKVKDRRVVLPSGMSYAVLVLPDSDRMRPELLGKVVELKKARARMFVPRKIVASPGVKGDAEVAKLAAELPVDGLDRFYPGAAVELPEELVWAHRRVDGRDVYFVSNQQEREVSFDVSKFHAKGEAEVWHTLDGRIGRAGETVTIGPADSVFVVFVEKSSAPAAAKFAQSGEILVAGPWKVKFPFGEVELSRPKSWAESADERVKYFSGTATYSAKFDAPKAGAAKLDLGDVAVMATVKLNGKDLGLVWKKPFVVDVSEAIREGENELEISVTNTWANRLIGDERFADVAEYKADARGRGAGIAKIPQWLSDGGKRPATTRETFVTWKHYKKDDPLQPAGLIGPVRILIGER